MRKRMGFNHLTCSSESSATGVSVCPEKEVCSTRAAPLLAVFCFWVFKSFFVSLRNKLEMWA